MLLNFDLKSLSNVPSYNYIVIYWTVIPSLIFLVVSIFFSIYNTQINILDIFCIHIWLFSRDTYVWKWNAKKPKELAAFDISTHNIFGKNR